MSSDAPIAKLSPLVWVSAFETGDSNTDEEHQELLVDLNELSDLLTQRQSWSVVVAQSRRLRDRCFDHFLDEERVLERAMYDRLPSHKTEHRLLEQQLDSIVTFIAPSRDRGGSAAPFDPRQSFLSARHRIQGARVRARSEKRRRFENLKSRRR
jgi:hemerythrin-like metal-binding protein